jgi:hypothetical protein
MYIINHVSAETLTTGWIIPPETNNPPGIDPLIVIKRTYLI